MAFWFGIGIAGLDALQKGLIKRYLSTDIRNPLRRVSFCTPRAFPRSAFG
jgi:hypothetical protein